MKKPREKTRIPWGFIILCSLVWAYVWLRAWFLQLNIDEAATFFMYLQTGRFFPPASTIDANNHILNSALSWASYKLFGPVPLAMRLPNILAALLYFYFVFKLGNLFSNKILKWVFFLLALGTHFLIEFYGYTRGYGLSMAMLAGVLHYTFKLNQKFRPGTLLKAYLVLLLGLLANFNLVFTALAFLAAIAFITWKKRMAISSGTRIRIILANLLIILPVLAYITFSAFQIRSNSGFYYGAPDGFIQVTARSLGSVLAGEWGPFLMIYLALLLSIVSISVIAGLFSRKASRNDLLPLITLLFILVSNWAGALILNKVWDVNFQEDRAAMHYIPLLFLFSLLGLDRLAQIRFPLSWLVALPLLAITVYSASRISLDSSIYGPRQVVPERYFEYISAEGDRSGFPPIVSAWQTRKQPWAFLNYTHGGRLNPIQSSGYPLEEADYIILEKELAGDMPEGFREVMKDEASSTILFARSAPVGWKLYESLQIQSHYNTPDPFENLFELSLAGDSIHDVMVNLECCIHSKFKPFEAVMVLEAFGPNKRSLRYEAIDLDQLRPRWRQKAGNFKYSLMISDIPPEADSVLLYFWNKKQALCTIEEARAEIFYQ